MIPGVSTACFYPQYTEQAMQLLVDHGPVAAAEVFINCETELEEGYLRELRKVADDGGTKVLSVHPYTSGMEPMYFFSAYDRRFDEGMELYKKFYRAANLLGANILVFHGAGRHRHVGYDEYFHRFGRLYEDAARYGIRLCHENVERCMSRSPAFFKALSKAFPDAGFVLDVKQVVRAGEDLGDFVRAMGNHIAHLHLSDNAPPGQDCLVPGTGVLNIADLLTSIGKSNDNIGVIVELYRDNFGTIVDIMQGYQHLCTILSTGLKND